MNNNEIEIPAEICEIVEICSDDSLSHRGKCMRIIERFAGESIYFPVRNVRNKRNQAIIDERNRGVPTLRIARKYHISQKRVYEIIRGE